MHWALLEAGEGIHLDETVGSLLAPLRTDTAVTVFAWVTGLGGPAALVAVVIVTTGLLWVHRHGDMVAPLWITRAGVQIAT